MPNWVITIVEFKGEQENIDNVFKEISDPVCGNADQNIFDFNKLCHMPEGLDIESGSYSDLAYAYYMVKVFNRLPERYHLNAQEVIARVENDLTKSPHDMIALGKTMADNIEMYGAKDWYEWRLNNWGTKWNACDCNADDQTLTFSTAWSWPQPIMVKLAELCNKHNVWFEGIWADEDCGCNTGTFSGVEGVMNYDYWDDCSNEAYETYVACWGGSDCIGQDADGRYHHYECDETCPNYTTCYGIDAKNVPTVFDITTDDEDLCEPDDALTTFLLDFNKGMMSDGIY